MPQRIRAFSQIIDLLAVEDQSALNFLDLGSGDGPLAGLILERFPRSTARLVDFSIPMIDLGHRKLAQFAKRYKYVEWDLNLGHWPTQLEGPFDAVVSSSALHHLEDTRKQWLFYQIFNQLVPGGWFANFDFLRDPMATIREDDIHARTCATLTETIKFLKKAGYGDIDTLSQWQLGTTYVLALVVGRKVP